MKAAEADDVFAPKAVGRRAILIFAIASGLLLLIAHEAIESKAAWFASNLTRTLWFSLATAPTLFAALTVRHPGARRFLIGSGAYTLLVGTLAFYAGRAIAPAAVEPWPVLGPYGAVLIASGHVLTAWFAVWLAGRGFGYPMLFEAAWRQLSTLLQALAYTLAFWLLLMLWAALFRALGIGFFGELFEMPRFVYPATSLVAGAGLVLARSRSSLGDAVHLRILALWRGLLPLATVLALAFAAALLFKGVQPLWETRHATQLLLALIIALVALANAAYGKGAEPAMHPWLQRLVQLALLLLPLFAALAAWALWLRLRQYGLSLDRLWAALAVLVAGGYSVGYAVAAIRKQQPFLADIATVNRTASLTGAVLLLLTQTGLLDFRAITAHTLRDRGDALSDEDLTYLRWQLGSPGLTALDALRKDRSTRNPESAARITALLAQTTRYNPLETAPDEVLDYHLAAGADAPPQTLRDALLAEGPPKRFGSGDGKLRCWLHAIDLDAAPPAEWLRICLATNTNNKTGEELVEVYQLEGDSWHRVADAQQWLCEADYQAALAALDEGRISTEPRRWQQLRIGEARLRFDGD